MYLQVALNGLMVGGLYTLMGSGFTLQWGISGIINLSYGGMTILGAYIAFFLFRQVGLQPVISLFPAGILLFLFGYAMYWFFLRRTIERGSFFTTLIMAYAVELCLENIMRLIWSSDYRMITASYSSMGIKFTGAQVPGNKVIVFIVSIVIVAIISQFMSRTTVGKSIQATALNPTGAKNIGIDVNRMHALNFAIGSAIAGISGALLSNMLSFSVVTAGNLIGKVFIIAILGGLGNIWGALLGGMTLGLVESFSGALIGTQWNQAVGLVVMVLVLVFRPRGLISRKYWNV